MQHLATASVAVLMATAVAFGAVTTGFAADFGKWKVKRVSDPMNDTSVALVMTQSETGDVTLGLTCRKDTGEVGIIWKRFLGGEVVNGEEWKDITYRIDQNRPVVGPWKVMPDRTTVRSFTPEGFIGQIRDSDRLAVQVEPYQEMPLTVVFETTGLKEALLATSPECDWFVRDILWKQRVEEEKKNPPPPVKPVAPAPFKPWTQDAATK